MCVRPVDLLLFFDVTDCVWMFLCEETTNGEITAVLEQRKRAGFKK